MPIQSPVYGRCGRIGLIVPANNSVIEPEFWSVLPPGVAAYAHQGDGERRPDGRSREAHGGGRQFGGGRNRRNRGRRHRLLRHGHNIHHGGGLERGCG